MAEKITTKTDGSLHVPDEPIIPYVEGDGTGVDIWPAAQLVMDAAAAKHGNKIAWKEVLAGERAFNANGSVDTSFGNQGQVNLKIMFASEAMATAVTSDGHIVGNRDLWTVTSTHPGGSLTVSHRSGHGTVTLPVDYACQHVRLSPLRTEQAHGAPPHGCLRRAAVCRRRTSGPDDSASVTVESVMAMRRAPATRSPRR